MTDPAVAALLAHSDRLRQQIREADELASDHERRVESYRTQARILREQDDKIRAGIERLKTSA